MVATASQKNNSIKAAFRELIVLLLLDCFAEKETFSCCVLYCFVLHGAGSFIFILMPVFFMPQVMVRSCCPRLISQDPGVMSYNNLNISQQKQKLFKIYPRALVLYFLPA